jgi:adenine deaminase
VNAPIASATQALADVRVALGEQPADLLLAGCQVVNVYSQQIHRSDVAIRGSRIVAVRENYPGRAHQTIDCEKFHALPGFVQLAPGALSVGASRPAFAQVSMTWGVTSWITQEIAATGSLVAREGSSGQPYPWRQWSTRGIATHRICTNTEDAKEAIRSGRTVFLAESVGTDLAAMLGDLQEHGMDTSRLCLSLGDCATASVRAALACGISAARLFQMASLNSAMSFGLDHLVGSISPARKADIILLRDLDHFPPSCLIFDGRIVAKEGAAWRP